MYRGSGRRKLAGRKDLSFGALSARGAYVTQPRRMGTVQPLVRLGFVEPAPQRFNLYQLSPVGAELLDPFGSEKRALLEWAKGSSAPTVRRLWPSERLPQVAASLLDRQLRQFGNGDDALRRRALLSSPPAATFAVSPLLEPRPRGNIDSEHWADLRSGVALVQLRNAAVALLARVEQLIAANTRTVLQPEAAVAPAGAELADLANAARVVGAEADTSPGREAHEFARVCMSSPASVILELARRDGAVVRLLSDGRLGLGSAGGTTMATVEEGVDGDDDAQALALAEGPPLVPELPRVANLYALAGDVALDRTADQ